MHERLVVGDIVRCMLYTHGLVLGADYTVIAVQQDLMGQMVRVRQVGGVYCAPFYWALRFSRTGQRVPVTVLDQRAPYAGSDG